MRHLVAGRKLSRDTSARRALLFNLASSLFESGQLITTAAKAKFVKPYAEKLITGAKRGKNLKAQRRIAAHVSARAFEKLRGGIAPGFGNRQGGYTRIIKLSPRRGDAAPMARLELLPYEKPKSKRD